MNKPKLLTLSTTLAFVFIFAITGLDIVLSYLGWKPTFGDDLLAGVIGFLPSIGSVSLAMLVGVTKSWKTKFLASIIWLFCIIISLSGNFLNMTARAFESLNTENVAKVEVSNVKDVNVIQISELKNVHQERISALKSSHQERTQSLKSANKDQLALFDQEISSLVEQYEKAMAARDLQIHDGVNRDGSVGPKARAFQLSMDQISSDIERKSDQKRAFQVKSTADLLKLQDDSTAALLKLQDELAQSLLQFQKQNSNTLSKANVDLVETQNDMKGHMPVIRYFVPNKDTQRQVVLYGLWLFAGVISLAGPIVSYAMAVHLNHKKLIIDTLTRNSPDVDKTKKKKKVKIKKKVEEYNNKKSTPKIAASTKKTEEVAKVKEVEEVEEVERVEAIPETDEEVKKKKILRYLGYQA